MGGKTATPLERRRAPGERWPALWAATAEQVPRANRSSRPGDLGVAHRLFHTVEPLSHDLERRPGSRVPIVEQRKSTFDQSRSDLFRGVL